MKKYVPPQAARLSDVTTATTMACLWGFVGNADVCASGNGVQPRNVCYEGGAVPPPGHYIEDMRPGRN
jgi:hypothetical protein